MTALVCPSDAGAANDFLGKLAQQALAERVPLSGTVELTARCNLRCGHCYLGSLRGRQAPAGASSARDSSELGTERLLAILDEAISAGLLTLLLTGGEPLLRRDFITIYRHVRERGVMVTVFTNATLVDDAHLQLFAELPPDLVEVSLYGASAATYEAVTGVAGSFGRCLAGIERLLAAGVRVALKSVIMTTNVHELDALRALAAHYEAPFRFDVAVSACLDGDLAPVDLRLPADQAVELELADPQRREQWLMHYDRLKAIPVPQRRYGCGAGVNSFYLDAKGVVFPCLMAREVSYDAGMHGFTSGWYDALPRLAQIEAGAGNACIQCESRALCDACPGFLALETGDAEGYSEYLCTVAKARDAAVNQDLYARGATP